MTGFIPFLGTFVKRVLFFVCGFIIAFPVAGMVCYFGSTPNGLMRDLNPISVICGIILFIIGIAMIVYGVKLKE